MKLEIIGQNDFGLDGKIVIETKEFADTKFTINGGSTGIGAISLKKRQLRNLKDYLTILLKD